MPQAKPAKMTTDGYESQFAINHMAHALIIRELWKALSDSLNSRIVSLTSTGAFMPSGIPGGIDFEAVKTEQDEGDSARWSRYAQSKLANICYVQALAKHHPDVTSVAVHPGIIQTDLVSSLSKEDQAMIEKSAGGKHTKPEEGAYNTVWAATSDKVESGQFYEPVGKVGQTNEHTTNPELAEKLYTWTQNELSSI